MREAHQGVEVSNAQGEVHAESVNGDVMLTGITSSMVDASSVNGGICYRGSIAKNGHYHFSTHNGDVHLGLPDDPGAQLDTDRWPDLRRRIAAVFRTRTRDEWAADLEQTDCCVTPVLSLREAAEHPHNVARRSLRTIDGVLQPAPAPRFSLDPALQPGRPPLAGQDTLAVLAELGMDAEALISRGVAAVPEPASL